MKEFYCPNVHCTRVGQVVSIPEMEEGSLRQPECSCCEMPMARVDELTHLPATTDTKPAMDQQVGGSHYKKLAIQPAEYAFKNNLGYLEGNVVKYISRHADKGGAEDVKKALHYCQMILQLQYNQ